MKLKIALLSLLILGIAGCGSGSSAAKTPYKNTDGYPLDICMVTGQKLGSMGDPFVVKFEGKTVKFCCSSCIKDFNKDRAKYMAILDEATKKGAMAQ